ncbi:MAG: hypothetical protein IT276_15205 [Ignavibacteriaceae bacterium]|nr:hypothetical protein [Ignavibacteriaceae bacterium]HRP91664.1 hypothetical protein [Ignavibacteriaceae bacterium]
MKSAKVYKTKNPLPVDSHSASLKIRTLLWASDGNGCKNFLSSCPPRRIVEG